VLATQLRNLGQPPADVCLMLRQAEADRHHAGWRRVMRHRLPIAGRLQHFGADFRAHQRVGEVLVQPAVGVGPGWQDRG
jgi:hypothetical protein